MPVEKTVNPQPAPSVKKEEPLFVHPSVTIKIVPEQEKVVVIKLDAAGRESFIEFPFEKLGRELEFKGLLLVQIRTYWDEVAAGVKTGIHTIKKVK